MTANTRTLPNGLVVLDASTRTYAALSRDGTYWHLIQPLRDDIRGVFDYTDANGQTVSPVAVGELVCTCAGGRFHRHCYRLDQANAYEREAAGDAIWGVTADPPAAESRRGRRPAREAVSA